jgi:hypothetical protein
MEPLLEPGDLAVVRRSDSYQVGDVVAYRSPDLGAVVLHRIVAREGDRFVMKGDNNDWLDAFTPAPGEVIGEMVLHLPGMGGRLGAVRTPLGASSLVAIGAIGVLGGRKRMRGRHHRRERDPRGPAVTREPALDGRRAGRRAGSGWRVGTAAFGLLTILGAALGAVSLLLPPTRTVTDDLTYEQRGTFSYQAHVAGGEAVYGADLVGDGDPVYLKLTDRVRVAFRYAFESPAGAELHGSVALAAVLSDVNGWSRRFELAPTAPFAGSEASASGSLRLDELRRAIEDLEGVTGVDRLAYSVEVVARVEVAGTLAGQELGRTFEPRLAFLLDDFQLQVERVSAPSAGEGSTDPLHAASGGLLKMSREVPRTFEVLGVSLGLAPLRDAAAVLLAMGIAGLGLAIVRRLRAARRGEAALIQARYGSWLVPVHTNGGYRAGRILEVEDFESLLQLADHYGHMVLYDRSGAAHEYMVEEGGVTYRYRTSVPSGVDW